MPKLGSVRMKEFNKTKKDRICSQYTRDCGVTRDNYNSQELGTLA